MRSYIYSTWVWSKCVFALCPCPHDTPRYESAQHMVPPYFFPVDKRLETQFAQVQLVCTEDFPRVRGTPVALPALRESAEYICIIGATRGVLSALDAGRLLAIYANQTVHPARANAIMKG
eukprot:4607978-Alexandrium_andersonii.AAC.1